MLAAVQPHSFSWSPSLSFSLGNRNGCNTHKSCESVCLPTASFTVSLCSKRHKLIMSRKKRQQFVATLSLSLSLFLFLCCVFDVQRRCHIIALVARGSLQWSSLVCWCPGRTHCQLCRGSIISQSCKVKWRIKSLPSVATETLRKNNFALNVAQQLGSGLGIFLVVSRLD